MVTDPALSLLWPGSLLWQDLVPDPGISVCRGYSQIKKKIRVHKDLLDAKIKLLFCYLM